MASRDSKAGPNARLKAWAYQPLLRKTFPVSVSLAATFPYVTQSFNRNSSNRHDIFYQSTDPNDHSLQPSSLLFFSVDMKPKSTIRSQADCLYRMRFQTFLTSTAFLPALHRMAECLETLTRSSVQAHVLVDIPPQLSMWLTMALLQLHAVTRTYQGAANLSAECFH